MSCLERTGYTAKDLVLALQHMLAMLGGCITVPIIAGMNIQLALISAGFATIFFHFITKRKVPVFLGSSFAFVPPMQEMLKNPETQSPFLPGTTDYNRRSLAIMLGLIGAGMVYIVLSLVIRRAGVRKVRKFFPPIVVGPVIVVIGLSLAGVVMVFYIFMSKCIPWHSASAAAITGVTIILVNAIAKPDSFVKVVPIIFGLLVGYVYSVVLSLLTPDGSVPLINFETMLVARFPEIFQHQVPE